MKERNEVFDGKGNLISVEEKIFSTEDVLNRRAAEYPDIGDQLDAIWKQLNYDRMQGRQLIQEADDRLNEVLAVKARHPKPTKEESK
jgi:hypothetical protein